ncbi:MAG TPA: vWA domain-containing protein [Burkholderiaceae bacterium]|nr:vWA domain-containing protein [Burkholderiaceae bacterium]
MNLLHDLRRLLSALPVRAALLAVVALIAAALAAPRPVLPRRVFDGIVVLDITQSMNTLDALLDGRPASRLAFAKAWLHRALAQLPCGARVGWGVFTEYRSYVLLLPVEVCANYAELSGSLDRIDGTMAWAGGSEISKGLFSALRISARMPERPAVVFFTDGHEAPPLRSDYAPAVPDDATDPHGLVVGVGGDELRPIPKYDPTGQPIGVWGPEEVMQAAPQAGSGEPQRPQSSPPAAGTEHLSSLKQDHLRELAALSSLGYVRLKPATAVSEILQDRRATRRLPVPVDARAPLEAIALALLVLAIGPRRRVPAAIQRRVRRIQSYFI